MGWMARMLATMAALVWPVGAAAAELRLHTADFPPFAIADSAERPGIVVELGRELARRAGIGFSVSFEPWARAQAEVRDGHDAAIMPLGRTPEREGRYTWVTEVLVYGVNFVSADGRRHDLDGARRLGSVRVQDGTSFLEDLRAKGFTNLKTATDTADNARILAAGRADAWYVPEIEARWLWHRHGLAGTPTIGPRIGVEQAWLALSPGADPDLVAALRRHFQTMVDDGTRDRVVASYSPPLFK